MTGTLSTKIKQFAAKRPVLLLVLIFIVSILFRLPQLTRPLSKHFELNTAFVLISTDVWQKDGFRLSRAAPVHTYRGEYNVPAGLYEGPFTQLVISGAYLSFGPGSYWLPYFYFKAFHLSPSVAGIRIFNLLLQLISVILIYQLALAFCKDKAIAVTTGITAIFCPVAMWFQGNAYCHEVAIIPMYLGMLLLLYHMWHAKQLSIAQHVGFAALLYVAALTDWLALFLCFVVLCLQVIQRIRKGTWSGTLIATVVLVPLLAIGTILYIYNNVVGSTELIGFIKATFFHRSVWGDVPSSATNNFLNIFIYLFAGYGFVIPVIAIALFNREVRTFFIRAHPAMIIAAIAPLLHYIVFYNFANEHDYAALKWIALFPLAAAYSIHTLWRTKPVIRQLLILSCILLNGFIFYWINFPGQTTRKAERYDWQETTGHTIMQSAAPGEYIFTNQELASSVLNWYAKRQIILVTDSADAQRMFNRLKGAKAAYIEMTGFTITRIIHLAKQ